MYYSWMSEYTVKKLFVFIGKMLTYEPLGGLDKNIFLHGSLLKENYAS